VTTYLNFQSSRSSGRAQTAPVGSAGQQWKMKSRVVSRDVGGVSRGMTCELPSNHMTLDKLTTSPANKHHIGRSRLGGLWPSAAGRTATNGNEDLTMTSLQILLTHHEATSLAIYF